MMILQARGRTTAEELAQALEVSTRTIYRDVNALSSAGVPVYADGGPGGGYALLDSYRTTLTGLKEDEVRALFMLAIPGPLADLQISQPLKAAILKVTGALPGHIQETRRAIDNRLYLDAKGWFQQEESLRYLKTVEEAVWQERQLRMTYRRQDGSVRQRMVSPYGLVAKAGVWYLVAAAGSGIRVYRISRVEAAELLDETFTRPAEFDLIQYWNNWAAEYAAMLPEYPVTLSVAPDFIPRLPQILGEAVKPFLEEASVGHDGRAVITYTFERLEEARAYILGMGSAVTVLEPEELRASVVAFAQEILAHYTP
jgi:predicted DNA-binding transcriptional regulator YafY